MGTSPPKLINNDALWLPCLANLMKVLYLFLSHSSNSSLHKEPPRAPASNSLGSPQRQSVYNVTPKLTPSGAGLSMEIMEIPVERLSGIARRRVISRVYFGLS